MGAVDTEVRRRIMAEAKAASFEESLLHELRFGGLEKENLKELVSIVAGIQRSGVKEMRVLPRGTPPMIEGLRVSGTIGQSELARFAGEVLARTPRLGVARLFPYGIPWPEIWRIDLDIGAAAVAEEQ
jgi:hypothetical protein